MMEHFTGRSWDNELATITRIYSAEGNYRADFQITMPDGVVIQDFARMGSTRKATMSQKLCESIGAMPYQDAPEKAFPFEAILKQNGSGKGSHYIIDQLMIGDETVKCMESLKFFETTNGETTYLRHKGAWHKVAGCVKRHKDNLLIEFKLYDPRIERMQDYPIMYSTYANNWVVVRTGEARESEKVA